MTVNAHSQAQASALSHEEPLKPDLLTMKLSEMLGLSESNLAEGGRLRGKPTNQSVEGTLKRMSDC
jgi:hypothetical protein